MNLKKMMMASALLMAACCMQAQTKVIAHRGFWKTPGSSQNSISSLLKADSIGCYRLGKFSPLDNLSQVSASPLEYSIGLILYTGSWLTTNLLSFAIHTSNSEP